MHLLAFSGESMGKHYILVSPLPSLTSGFVSSPVPEPQLWHDAPFLWESGHLET